MSALSLFILPEERCVHHNASLGALFAKRYSGSLLRNVVLRIQCIHSAFRQEGTMKIEVAVVDYTNEKQAHDLVELLDGYARDPMGGGEALETENKTRLVAELSKLPHAFSVIAYADGKAAGLVNCFLGFSTFAARPLVNIHDVAVSSDFRGQGIAQHMLNKVEEIAKEKGCCKMTLEVLQGNLTAQSSYRKFGFSGYELDPEMGQAVFWQKKLAE
ncbi:putative acetyltransferase [Leminorella richardii]|uniref:Putative acetyltransferase n=2 Tax=Leminorella richardii TaxID=158841 RepID=A0A2X4V7V4_9GAMM|nr:putative acetyltransferase [Leminorella richardii]